MVPSSRALNVIFCLAISVIPASAGAIRSIPGALPTSLHQGDDVSSPAVPLGFTINFLGQSSSAAYVNTNGDITFSSPYVGYPGAPEPNMAGGVIPPISSAAQPIISAFLSDVDLPAKSVGSITYGTTTLGGRPAFVVNYSKVTYFSFTGVDFDRKHNSFQIVLLERSDTGAGNFDIELNYDQIEWETADSNGGTNGFGGYAALVGYSNGTRAPGTFFALPGSGVPGSFADGAGLSLVNGSYSSGVAGRYIFEIRNGTAAVLTSLNPANAAQGGAPFTLTVNGSGFAAHSTVMWNGSPVPTTFVSATQLTAVVTANLIDLPGAAMVKVVADGISSNGLVFTVGAPLSLTSLSLSNMHAGSDGFMLALTGAGFAADSIVLLNGAPLPTTFVSTTQLTAALPANLAASSSAPTVRVIAGGVSSNERSFTIAAPPSLVSMNPSTSLAGSPGFSLTLTGTGFGEDSIVLWNGAPLPTGFVSTTELTAVVTTNLIASQHVATVTVTAGGNVSNVLGFTIVAPLSITRLDPSIIMAGSAPFALTLNGSGFDASSVVLWNGISLPTTFVTSTQVTAVIPAELVVSAGFATVAVNTAGVTSNSAALTITVPGAPLISSLNPVAVKAGGPAFKLTVDGSGFADSLILWDGAVIPTTFVSTNQLTAFIPSNLIASPGVSNITVSAVGRTTSNALPIAITGSAPISDSSSR